LDDDIAHRGIEKQAAIDSLLAFFLDFLRKYGKRAYYGQDKV